jgi:excisionase family DNA binding protein
VAADRASLYHQSMAVTLITADEVAAHLRVTRAWVLAEARAGRLAHYRLNRKVRFTWEQVEAFLADREARLARPAVPRGRTPATRIPGALFPEGADPGGTVTAHHAAPPRAA